MKIVLGLVGVLIILPILTLGVFAIAIRDLEKQYRGDRH